MPCRDSGSAKKNKLKKGRKSPCLSHFCGIRLSEREAVAAGVVAIFAVTSIADLRGSNKKIVSLAKKREQIEQEMRDKQA